MPKGKPNKDTALTCIYNIYKSRCKKQNKEFSLTKDEFRELIKQNCYYCGSGHSNLYDVPHVIPMTYNGIDRVENEYGYVLENCVPCCKVCNRAKQSMPAIEFIKWLDQVVNYRR